MLSVPMAASGAAVKSGSKRLEKRVQSFGLLGSSTWRGNRIQALDFAHVNVIAVPGMVVVDCVLGGYQEFFFKRNDPTEV